MHTPMVETVPAGAPAPFPEPVEEGLAAIGVEHVMLAGNEEDREPELLQHLLGIVELVVARELRDIARVDYEVGPLRQRLHLGDRLAEGGSGVSVGGLVEADM